MTATLMQQERAAYLLGRYAAAPLRVVSHEITGDVLTIVSMQGDRPDPSRYRWIEKRQDWETMPRSE